MQTSLRFEALDVIETPALAVVVFDKEGPVGPRLEGIPAVRRLVEQFFESGEFRGRPFEAFMVHRPDGLKAQRLLLLGAGKRERFGPVDLRRLAGSAARFLRPKSIADFVILPDGALTDVECARAVVEGIVVADFDADRYKTDNKDRPKPVESVAIAGLDASARGTIEEAVRRSQIIAESQNMARELINEPSNRMTPTMLAERARAMAEEAGLQCEVLDRAALESLKMGSFLAVAQGSAEPPALIVLRYEPAGVPASPQLGLVGKGVTFDTGGISIKPAEGMEKMKYDMAGGASTIAAMRAIALLRPPIRVVGLVPATENMPGGRAQKPGDIQVAMSGKTIEVLNTDAEGRMILADALHYAKTIGCTHLVDSATLTGACAVALGTVNAGAFTNNDEFAGQLLAASREAGEKIWQMPMDDDYREQIKGHMADILNTGGRYGGAITAAWFLREFAGDTPWVHLDIAGVAWIDDNKPYIAKGASGMGVRTMVTLALRMAETARGKT